ncbi:hypothetical protein [Delftia sp. PS-11]|uniref:hypothetical protein n=1 Tax=Delftia sp. PS-11 TaxID=2767222 RepID=UPI002454B6CE|nr:hypothetical protein [Delftia sp. PS-11]KAJ8745456.1 hypothetical protein H9T68_06565 [Delftia sp. PS-11]
MANSIVIEIKHVGPGTVQVESDLQAPRVGAPLAPQESAALEMIQHIQRQPACRRVIFDSNRIDPDAAACVALVRDLLDPEGLGHSVSAEVRNAARRAFGIKGQQEGLAA